MKKRHRWTTADEQVILDNSNLRPEEIRDRFFKKLSLHSVKHKLQRLLQEQAFPTVGPLTQDELNFFSANLDMPNAEIQKIIPRPVKDLDFIRYAIRHGKSTNLRGPHRARGVEVAMKYEPTIAQNDLFNGQHGLAWKIKQISNSELRNTAEVQLTEVRKHLSIIGKLLEINELVKEGD